MCLRGLKTYKWYQNGLALAFRSFDLRIDPWSLLSWNTVTLLWSHLTLMGPTMPIGKQVWKYSWNLLMRELGTLLNIDGRSPLLQLVSDKLLRKKQPLLIAKSWMLFLMLFLWRNSRESPMLRLLILHGIFSKLRMKAQRHKGS